jgi:oligoribonuclease
VIITDGNLNILNDIYLDMNEKCNQYLYLVGFLHKNILVNRSSPICGQGVHIDRARIERILPEFISCCHYRSIDVDVLNVLCRRWAKTVYENRPYVTKRKIFFLKMISFYFRTVFNNSNDLKIELQGSIQLLQYYRANVFKSDLFVQE